MTEGFAQTYYIWIAYVMLLIFWIYKDMVERKFFLERFNASKTNEKFKEILTQDIPASVLVVDAYNPLVKLSSNAEFNK